MILATFLTLKKRDRILARLRGIQRVRYGGRNQFLLELEKQLDNEHNQALRRGNSLVSKNSMLVDFEWG